MTTGSCLCGTVRWRMEGPFEGMSHCHCSMCRKAHAAPFATYVAVKAERFELLSGADAITVFQSSSTLSRRFCSQCGSVAPIDAGDRLYVPAGCLDDDPGIRPQRHIFVGSKAPWYGISDDLPQADEYDSAVPAQSAAAPEVPDILHGSCLCGGVAFAVATPILVAYNCHCSRCRKARAAAHTTNGFVERDGLQFLRGEDLLERYKVPDAQFFTQAFCRVCGSGMPNIDPSRPRVAIPFGVLDDNPGQGAGEHIYCDSKAPWYTITDGLPQNAERPPQ